MKLFVISLLVSGLVGHYLWDFGLEGWSKTGMLEQAQIANHYGVRLIQLSLVLIPIFRFVLSRRS